MEYEIKIKGFFVMTFMITIICKSLLIVDTLRFLDWLEISLILAVTSLLLHSSHDDL